MSCPASVDFEARFPDSSSPFAQEGTRAHELAAQFLLDDTNATDDLSLFEDKDGEEPFTDTPAETADYIQFYLDYVRGFKGDRLIETRVDFSPWVEGGFGTADVINFDGDTLRVIDLKYGKHVRVNADNNVQGLLYALGAHNDHGWLHNINKIVIAIVQPRQDHISEWEIDEEELLAWADTAQDAAKDALRPDPEFRPSESACQWCRGKESCEARAVSIMRAVSDDFADFATPFTVKDKGVLGLDEIGLLLPRLAQVTSFVDGVKRRAYAAAMDGQTVLGHKLVEGRSSRDWADEDEAERALSTKLEPDQIYKTSIISPYQAEKLIGKRNPIFDQMVKKTSGKPSLVPVDDKRPEIVIDVASEFDGIDLA